MKNWISKNLMVSTIVLSLALMSLGAVYDLVVDSNGICTRAVNFIANVKASHAFYVNRTAMWNYSDNSPLGTTTATANAFVLRDADAFITASAFYGNGASLTGLTAATAKNTANLISISGAAYTDFVGDYVCPNVFSDQSTWATAVAACKNGDTLKVYPGTYTFSDELVVDKSITIEGLDRSLCIIQTDTGGDHGLIRATVPGVILKYLKITNNGNNLSGNVRPLVKFGTGASGSQLVDCFLNSCYGYIGISVTDSAAYVNIDRNIIKGNSQTTGLELGYAPYINIYENDFGYDDNINYGIKGTASNGAGQYSVIEKNKFQGYTGISLSNTATLNMRILNNNFTDGTVSINIDNNHPSGVIGNLFISGNTIVGNGYAPSGITLSGVSTATLLGNTFSGNTASNIVLANGTGGQGCSNVYVHGNTGDGVTPASVIETGLTDYTILQGMVKLGTETLIGAHSVNRDAAAAPITPTTVINQFAQAIHANSFNSNVGALLIYSPVIDALTDGQSVKIQQQSNVAFCNSTIDASNASIQAIWTFNNALITDGKSYCTLTNTGVTQAAGKNKSGAVFNGSATFTATLSNPSNIYPHSTGWSMNVWVKKGATGVSYGIWNVGSNRCSFQLRSDGNSAWDIYDGTHEGYAVYAATDDTNWHMYTCTWDGSNVKTYQDANSLGADKALTTLNQNDTAMAFGSYGGAFNGSMDEAIIWNVSLSAAQITALYNSGAGRFYDFPAIIITPPSGKQIKKWTSAADATITLSEFGQYVELRADSNGDLWPVGLIGNTPTTP